MQSILRQPKKIKFPLRYLPGLRYNMTDSALKPARQPQQIQPTPTEETFFGHLNDFVNKGRLGVEPEIPATECRIAGGWVRDKVMLA
jgi:hypothetical protein